MMSCRSPEAWLSTWSWMNFLPLMFLVPGLVLWQLAPIRGVVLVAILISHGPVVSILILQRWRPWGGGDFLRYYWIILTIVSIGLAASGLLFGY